MPKLQIPEAFEPLLAPCRYKVMYGGRGSAKSWSAARVLLHQGTIDPLRVLCVREVMRTIADSVHRLLADQVKELGLEHWYSVTDNAIVGVNGAEFLFAGLRALDAHKIKSYEGVDVAWCEEAQAISKRSWEILIPTIRADDSEIWLTLNPEMDTDDTFTRFIANPPDGAWVKKVTWRDNPWFPHVLEQERRSLEKRDPEEYANVWEGMPRSVVPGAIYSKEVTKMLEEQRFRNVPYDPRLRVHTIHDIGWNDQHTVIFAQRLHSEVRVIDYEEESFLRPDEWAKRINAKPYVYGDHWLPHDGDHETEAGRGVSLKMQYRPLLGVMPKIIGRPESVELPVRAARMMFPRVYMDATKCARLMECLKRFRRAVPDSTGEPGAPVKDEFRHGADAFGGLALIVDKLTNDGIERVRYPLADTSPSVRGVM